MLQSSKDHDHIEHQLLYRVTAHLFSGTFGDSSHLFASVPRGRFYWGRFYRGRFSPFALGTLLTFLLRGRFSPFCYSARGRFSPFCSRRCALVVKDRVGASTRSFRGFERMCMSALKPAYVMQCRRLGMNGLSAGFCNKIAHIRPTATVSDNRF